LHINNNKYSIINKYTLYSITNKNDILKTSKALEKKYHSKKLYVIYFKYEYAFIHVAEKLYLLSLLYVMHQFIFIL